MSPVQDVGLIFLSSMATSIAAICVEQGYEDHEALGTALLTLALSTLLVGVLIMLVGAPLSRRSFLVTPLKVFLS
jgi:sulfate permease, SulP family